MCMFIGGENTPMNETSFEGVTPKKRSVTTPNVVLGTPFRTPNQAMGSTPGRMMTPQMSSDRSLIGNATPSRTPLRDQLSINADGTMESFSDVGTIKQQQLELRAHLRAGLGSLPAPKNDFEIVLPEGDALMDGDVVEDGLMVEDASIIEERNAQIRKAEGK